MIQWTNVFLCWSAVVLQHSLRRNIPHEQREDTSTPFIRQSEHRILSVRIINVVKVWPFICTHLRWSPLVHADMRHPRSYFRSNIDDYISIQNTHETHPQNFVKWRLHKSVNKGLFLNVSHSVKCRCSVYFKYINVFSISRYFEWIYISIQEPHSTFRGFSASSEETLRILSVLLYGEPWRRLCAHRHRLTTIET